MHFAPLLLSSLSIAAANILPSIPQNMFGNAEVGPEINRIPTSYESAVLARRILHLTPIGTLSTVFPSKASPRTPEGLDGIPIGLMDYIADCEGDGNPTILAINIATSFRNVAAGSNITLSLTWVPPYPPSSRIGLQNLFASPEVHTKYSAANLPRFSLLGHLEPIEPSIVDSLKLAKCFTDTHQDAKYWLPGNPIHTSEWVRLVVEKVYWIGGFGDRAYIGWIPVEEWRDVTDEEWKAVKLPGESKGWKEWAAEGFQWEL